MTRKTYSKSEIKSISNEFPMLNLSKKDTVVEEDGKLYVNNILSLFKVDGFWIPSLKLLLNNDSLLPKVIVDMGAVKFVVKGADIMRPGIVSCEEFEKDSFVIIVDENNKKPLSVGKSILSSSDLMEASSGKVIKNLHFVGDDLWTAV